MVLDSRVGRARCRPAPGRHRARRCPVRCARRWSDPAAAPGRAGDGKGTVPAVGGRVELLGAELLEHQQLLRERLRAEHRARLAVGGVVERALVTALHHVVGALALLQELVARELQRALVGLGQVQQLLQGLRGIGRLVAVRRNIARARRAEGVQRRLGREGHRRHGGQADGRQKEFACRPCAWSRPALTRVHRKAPQVCWSVSSQVRNKLIAPATIGNAQSMPPALRQGKKVESIALLGEEKEAPKCRPACTRCNFLHPGEFPPLRGCLPARFPNEIGGRASHKQAPARRRKN